jgi:hypothetical protein
MRGLGGGACVSGHEESEAWCKTQTYHRLRRRGIGSTLNLRFADS